MGGEEQLEHPKIKLKCNSKCLSRYVELQLQPPFPYMTTTKIGKRPEQRGKAKDKIFSSLGALNFDLKDVFLTFLIAHNFQF
jgi:hypothetical protein